MWELMSSYLGTDRAAIQRQIVNHARGGGDGIARRISVVLDVGVDYREAVSYTHLTLPTILLV